MKHKKSLLPLLCLFFLSAPQLLRAQTPPKPPVLLHVLVTDFQDHPLKNETVMLKGKTNGKEFSCTTNAAGKCDITPDKGDVYTIQYLNFVEEKEYSEIEIDNGEGTMEGQLTVQMESNSTETYELDLHFETAKATLKAESFPLLDRLASQMKLKPTVMIEVAGHTDSDGEEAANLTLSQARANAVKTYLTNKGITATRIATKGFGESKPVADNETPAGKAKNRRTELRVTQW
jgi:OmpA-OmpF porin, OOP family